MYQNTNADKKTTPGADNEGKVRLNTCVVQGDLKEGKCFRSLGEKRNKEMRVPWWTNGQEEQRGGRYRGCGGVCELNSGGI